MAAIFPVEGFAGGLSSDGLARSILECSRDCIAVLSPDGKILAMNSQGRAALGIDATEAVEGHCFTALWREEDRSKCQAALQGA